MNKFNRFNKMLIMLIVILMIIGGCSPINNDVNAENPINVNKENVKADNKIPVDDAKIDQVIEGELEVHFIDVGQGDSILIKQGEHNMLIDAGDNHKGKDVVDYLRNENIKSLDYVIGTHPHADHIGGLDDVINSFEISKVIMPDKMHTTKTFEDVLNAIYSKNLKITKAVAGNEYELGNAKFTVLAPISNNDSNLNNHSVSIRLEYGNNSFMFTGDAENIAEQEIVNNGMNIQADVLKAGHHGSNTSNSDSFVNKVNPQYVVIQVGEGNKYNHPNTDIIEKFENMEIEIYRNDLHGTVVAKSDGKKIEFSINKGAAPKIKNNNSNTLSGNASPLDNPKSDVEKPIVEEKIIVNESISTEFIGTKTTKKFHKNNCRHIPKEDNRVYFNTLKEALDSGFEACKICKPE